MRGTGEPPRGNPRPSGWGGGQNIGHWHIIVVLWGVMLLLVYLADVRSKWASAAGWLSLIGMLGATAATNLYMLANPPRPLLPEPLLKYLALDDCRAFPHPNVNRHRRELFNLPAGQPQITFFTMRTLQGAFLTTPSLTLPRRSSLILLIPLAPMTIKSKSPSLANSTISWTA